MTFSPATIHGAYATGLFLSGRVKKVPDAAPHFNLFLKFWAKSPKASNSYQKFQPYIPHCFRPSLLMIIDLKEKHVWLNVEHADQGRQKSWIKDFEHFNMSNV